MRFFARSSRSRRRLLADRRGCSILPLLLVAMSSAIGCGGTRVSLTASDAIVRAGPDVRGRVYVWTGEAWELSANKVEVPEGWYIGPVDAAPSPASEASE